MATKRSLDLLQQASGVLTFKGVGNSTVEAEILLTHILQRSRIELYLDNPAVSERQSRDFWSLINARSNRLPLQYLIGSTEFMGLVFKLCPGVFIPRPETELLVEHLIQILSAQAGNSFVGSKNILDLGTGSGNIAISLAKYISVANIFACDISDFALQLARENALLHQVKIYLVKSNLFSAFREQNTFSLIVSNPPYLSTKELPFLPKEIYWEPRAAFEAGDDGLYYYRKIIQDCRIYLNSKGILALEIADAQADAVRKLLRSTGIFSQIMAIRDYNNQQRIIIAKRLN